METYTSAGTQRVIVADLDASHNKYPHFHSYFMHHYEIDLFYLRLMSSLKFLVIYKTGQRFQNIKIQLQEL